MCNCASLEPWAHEQLDMLGLESGMECELGPYYLSDQITMFYKACLDRGLCSNALELSDLAYRGDRDDAKRSLRVWMPMSAAEYVKAEEKETVSEGAVTADAAVPSNGAAAGGGEGSPKAEPIGSGRPAAAKDPEVKKEPPGAPYATIQRGVASESLETEVAAFRRAV